MAVPVLTRWFFAQVVAGAEGVLAASGYDVLLYSVPDSHAEQRFVDRRPFSKRVDGLIAVDLPFVSSGFERLTAQPGPLVTVAPSTTARHQSPSTTSTVRRRRHVTW